MVVQTAFDVSKKAVNVVGKFISCDKRAISKYCSAKTLFYTEGGTLQIFNSQGQEILNRSILAQSNDLNLVLPPVSNGLYLVSIKIVGQNVFLQKIILSK